MIFTRRALYVALLALLLSVWVSAVNRTIEDTASPSKLATRERPFAVFGYLPEYRQLRFDYEAFFKSGLTHLIFFSAEVDPTTLELVHVDDRLPSAANWRVVRRLADRYNVKLLLCIGGGGRSSGFSRLVGDVLGRRRFIQQLLRVVEERGLDGVDFNWEYPSSMTEWLNLGQFLIELRTSSTQFTDANKVRRSAKLQSIRSPAQPLLITMALHPHASIPHVLRSSRILPSLDYLHWMAYDHIVPDDGHSSLAYATLVLQEDMIGSLDDAINRARLARHRKTSAGPSAPPRTPDDVDHRRNLCLGIPFYGRHREDLRLQPETYEHLWQFIQQWARKRHAEWVDGGPELRALSNYAGYDFNGYDDVKRKMRLARAMGVGGIMIWELGQDVPPGTSPMSLMTAVHEQLTDWNRSAEAASDAGGGAPRATTVQMRGATAEHDSNDGATPKEPGSNTTAQRSAVKGPAHRASSNNDNDDL